MKIALVTLCLNEMEWLPRLWRQHKDWPDLCAWVFVEAADRLYAEANPDMVTRGGLSVDGTTEWLAELDNEHRGIVQYMPWGRCFDPDHPDQSKCIARNLYLKALEGVRPDFVWVLDADEFVSKHDQHDINLLMNADIAHDSFVFKMRHCWHPPNVADRPLFTWEAKGRFFDMGHVRGYRWFPGMQHAGDHNHVSVGGRSLFDSCRRVDEHHSVPYIVHMGYASQLLFRKAKSRYYVARGEGPADGREHYNECRRAWEVWEPVTDMPKGTSVEAWKGDVPECFLEETT